MEGTGRQNEGEGDLKSYLLERFQASMIFSGVGDAMGFRNGSWEFCHSGPAIIGEMMQITGGKGVRALHLKGGEWRVSDDTVMHIATAEALASDLKDKNDLCQKIGERYVACWDDMGGRAPGGTCSQGVGRLKSNGKGWNAIPWSRSSGGCGAAMRAMCIGLRYCHPRQLKDLVAIAIESGRMTHNNPVGYLGAVAAALFTSYSIQKVPFRLWGYKLLNEVLPICIAYIKDTGRDVDDNLAAMKYFIDRWTNFLQIRHILNPTTEKGPDFSQDFVENAAHRDTFYRQFSFSGWSGASGHDAPLIGYDAILYGKGDWDKVCTVGVLHAGDSDSTGTIALACFGARYGFADVPACNYVDMEYSDRLKLLGTNLFDVFIAEQGHSLDGLFYDSESVEPEANVISDIVLDENDYKVKCIAHLIELFCNSSIHGGDEDNNWKLFVDFLFNECDAELNYFSAHRFTFYNKFKPLKQFLLQYFTFYSNITVTWSPKKVYEKDTGVLYFEWTMNSTFTPKEEDAGYPIEKSGVQEVIFKNGKIKMLRTIYTPWLKREQEQTAQTLMTDIWTFMEENQTKK